MRAAALALVSAMVIAGCGGETSTASLDAAENQILVEGKGISPEDAYDLRTDALDDYAKMLYAKAQAFAAKELARMSAAELTYRNKAYFNEAKGEFFLPGTGVYMKMYRAFDEAEIVDIRRGDSFLHPVTYVIGFNYVLMGTEPRHTSLPNAAQLAQQDYRFSKLEAYRLTREYRCDHKGDPDGQLPPIPPRPSYYRRGYDEGDGYVPGGQLPGMAAAEAVAATTQNR